MARMETTIPALRGTLSGASTSTRSAATTGTATRIVTSDRASRRGRFHSHSGSVVRRPVTKEASGTAIPMRIPRTVASISDHPVPLRELVEERRAHLGRALLRLEVDMDQAIAVAEAGHPLEVVHR